ncbi:MAG: hypothetical protein R2864_06325 [Syntrophotaleaceae bacterium]
MLRYLLKRLLLMVPLLLGITLISLCGDSPGLLANRPIAVDPASRPRSVELQQRLWSQYDLDQPLMVQYGKWLGRLVRRAWRIPSQDWRPVASKIAERLPVLILINVLSIGLTLALAVPIGIVSAVRRNSLNRLNYYLLLYGFATRPLAGPADGCARGALRSFPTSASGRCGY